MSRFSRINFSLHPKTVNNSNNISTKDKNPADILQRSLLRKIKRVHHLAKEAGLFLNDRELLRCDRCGFLEDVDIKGRLIIY